VLPNGVDKSCNFFLENIDLDRIEDWVRVAILCIVLALLCTCSQAGEGNFQNAVNLLLEYEECQQNSGISWKIDFVGIRGMIVWLPFLRGCQR